MFNQGYVNTPHAEWGAGPYTIQKFDQQNGAIVFERNPKWWGKPGKLDTRTFLQMDSTAAINAFRNGQIDAVAVNGEGPAGPGQRAAGHRDPQGPDAADRLLHAQRRRAPSSSDPAVRKAIFEGIDRKQIAKFHFQGLNYTADPVASMNLLPFQKGYSDNFSKVVRFDPEQAKKDLDAAGWTVGADGIREKNGQPLQVSYVNTGDDAVGKAVAGGTAAMLKNIGVQMDIRQVPTSRLLQDRHGEAVRHVLLRRLPVRPLRPRLHLPVLLLGHAADPVRRERPRERRAGPVGQHAAHRRRSSTPGPPRRRPPPSPPTASCRRSTWSGSYAVKTGLANYGAGRFFSTTPENIGWQK